MKAKEYFKHEDVFPIIDRVIHELCQQHSGFISHEDIRSRFLNDVQGSSEIDAAVIRSGQKFDAQRMAGNMIAWFSQKITEGKGYTDQFERKKIKGKWAYKCKTDG